jgi:hypothetical protein
MFEIGQRVICVNDEFHPSAFALYSELPKKNSIYTVRDIVMGVNLEDLVQGEPALYLQELVNPPSRFGLERGFRCDRFAPLIEDFSLESAIETLTIDSPNPLRDVPIPELV